MDTNAVIVVLVGLPGVGKSTICKNLESYIQSKSDPQPLVIHVCYDDLIPLSVQKEFAQQKQDGGQEFEEGKSWKSARHAIYTRVDQLLEHTGSGCKNSDLLNFFNINKIIPDAAKYVVLLDDNFYYRSMRYQYFQLARKHAAGYCQLYFECDIETACERNLKREAQVPSGVVAVMGARLQPPQPHHYGWEANTCVLQDDNMKDYSRMWDTITWCFRHAAEPLEDRESEIREAREKCSESVVHQGDLYLRSLVGRLVREALSQGTVDRKQVSAFSARINAARQSVLAALRSGELRVPLCMAEAVGDDNREQFQALLEAEVRKNT